jgi:hypothetical protein
MERNSELFSLPGNGSERNSERLLLILFHGTEFRAFFSFADRFGTEFREFSVPRNSRNSAGTNQLFRLFYLPRNNFFFRKLPTLHLVPRSHFLIHGPTKPAASGALVALSHPWPNQTSCIWCLRGHSLIHGPTKPAGSSWRSNTSG